MRKEEKRARYTSALRRIRSQIDEEADPVAVMATVVRQLHRSFEYFDWTGFYCVVEPGLLKLGPFAGEDGCLEIPFGRGVCGAAASTRETQLVPDVRQARDHITCSPTTLSEIVVPVLAPDGSLLAVLDVDSDQLGAFDEVDRRNLEQLCTMIGARIGGGEAR